MLRRLLPLLALLGLVMAGPHAAAMAMPTADTMAMEMSPAETAPCHSEKAPEKLAEKPAKSPEGCCPDGCKGQCAPVFALTGSAPLLRSEAVVTVHRAKPRTLTPDGTPDRRDRPPRTFG